MMTDGSSTPVILGKSAILGKFGGDHLKVSIPSRRWPPAVKKRGAKHRVETFRFLVSEFEILP